MEKEKYYTPEISEFHVGFEFEEKERFGDGTVKTKEDFSNANWIKKSMEIGELYYIERMLSGRNALNGICGIRTKYLDREDIESFGFESIITKSIGKDHYTMSGEKSTRGNLLLEHDWLNDKITIKTPNYIRDGSRRFDDYIIYVNRLKCKNKSEFSRLLKQLSII